MFFRYEYIIQSTMIKQIKEALINNTEKCLSLLSRKSFIFNLTNDDLKQLTICLQSNSKLSHKIIISLYSIIIMKKYENYSHKLAIQNLTRCYKQAPQNCRKVIAGILLRIPNFTSYELIIKDINPSLVPLSLMLSHRQKIIKKCPNKYQQFIINRWKEEWVQLAVQVRKIQTDLAQLSQLAQENITDKLQLFEKMQEAKQYCSYLTQRVTHIKKQEINIKQITIQVQAILSLSPTNQLIIQVQNYIYEFLGVLCLKLKTTLLRILQWLHNIVYNSIISLKKGIRLVNAIILLKNVYIGMGPGCTCLDQYMYGQPYTVYKLMESLLYNNYQKNEENINYQKRNKSKITQISLYQANFYESHYENHLSSIDHEERENLLTNCLLLVCEYYRREQTLKKGSQFLNLLENSKNQLSFKNKCILLKLKEILMKGKSKSIPDLQIFCEEVFDCYLKKKLKKQLNFYNCFEMKLIPEKKTKNDLIKITKSIDMEGWASLDHSLSNNPPSEVFYSFKQGSVKDSKDKKQIEEEEMIFTPEF